MAGTVALAGLLSRPVFSATEKRPPAAASSRALDHAQPTQGAVGAAVGAQPVKHVGQALAHIVLVGPLQLSPRQLDEIVQQARMDQGRGTQFGGDRSRAHEGLSSWKFVAGGRAPPFVRFEPRRVTESLTRPGRTPA